MPEGPEVFIIAGLLRPKIVGNILSSIYFPHEKYENVIVNSKVEEIATKGKKLWFKLTNNMFILCFFGLEGEFKSYGKIDESKLIAEFTFENGQVYSLIDNMRIAKCSYINDIEKLIPQGVDPLQELFGMREWINLCKSYSNKNISKFITDQNIIAGVGNKYRSEILYIANINPVDKLRDIENIKLEILLVSIYRVLSLVSKNKYTTQVHNRKLDLKNRKVNKIKVFKGVYVWSLFPPKILNENTDTMQKRKSSSIYFDSSESETVSEE